MRIIKHLKNNNLLFSVFVAFLISVPSFAQNLDQKKIQKLVRKEVERLINDEKFLDSAIEKGIKNFIQKQNSYVAQKRRQQQQTQVKNLRPVDLKRDHIFGPLDAPITLIDYSDFECPYCKRFHPTVKQLLKNNQKKIRWVYRHYPLSFHNPGAQKQAEASECVAKLSGNNAFWVFADLIYKRTKSNGRGFPLEKLRPLAEEVGVNGNSFSKCLDSGEMTARVKEDIDNGTKIGITGTPAAFIFNKKGKMRFVAGALPLHDLQSMVDELTK